MTLSIIIIVLALSLPYSKARSLMEDWFHSKNLESNKFVKGKKYQEQLFPNADFYAVRVGMLRKLDHWENTHKYVIAIDKDSMIYPITNFKTNEFNSLVQKYPVTISVHNVYEYGKFYIQLQNLNSNNEYVFISKIDDFINFNEYYHTFKKRSANHPDKKFEDEKMKILNIFKDYDTSKLSYCSETKSFEIDYFYWQLCYGTLNKKTLRIDLNGKCTELDSVVLADKIGFYVNTH